MASAQNQAIQTNMKAGPNTGQQPTDATTPPANAQGAATGPQQASPADLPLTQELAQGDRLAAYKYTANMRNPPQKQIQQAVVQQATPSPQAVHIQGQEPLTSSMLAEANAHEQKQMLGERLYPVIHRWYPEMAGKVTGMLLEIDNLELLHMLEHHESLKANVEEAVAELQACQVAERINNFLRDIREPLYKRALQEQHYETLTEKEQHYGPLLIRHCIQRLLLSNPRPAMASAQNQAIQTNKMAEPNTGQETTTATASPADAQVAAGDPQQASPTCMPSTPNLAQEGCPVVYKHSANMHSPSQQQQVQQTDVQQAISAPQAVHFQAQEPLTSSMLVDANALKQKQMLGERIYSVICRWYPAIADKATCMLLEMENSELLHMLEHHESLKAKVDRKVEEFKVFQVAEKMKKLFSDYQGTCRENASKKEKVLPFMPNIAQEGRPAVYNYTDNMRSPPQQQQVKQTDVQRAISTVQAVHVQAQEPLTSAMLADASAQIQKQILGERLYPVIRRWYPGIAGKVTGMLLEIDNSELLHMLEYHESLKAKVEEAVAVLQAHLMPERVKNIESDARKPLHIKELLEHPKTWKEKFEGAFAMVEAFLAEEVSEETNK